MWILMKKTYSGTAGVFSAGNKMDLPDRTLKQIRKAGKGYYEESVPPWETNTDKEAVEKHKAISAANDVRKSVEKILTLIDRHRDSITQRETICDQIDAELEKISDEALKAEAFAEEQTVKATTKKDRKTARELTAQAKSLRIDATRAPFRQMRAEADLVAVTALVGLMQIDLGCAAEKYDKLATEAGVEIEKEFKERVIETLAFKPLRAEEIETEGTEDATEPEPENADKTETGNDGSDEQAKANDDTEGQTDQA